MHSDREKLVERLRSMPTCSCAGDGTEFPNLYAQAANEIERLAALSEPVKYEPVAQWRVGEWGDGSTKPGEAVIFCDAHEAAVAAGVPSHLAKMIVEAHNDTVTRPAGERPAVAVEADRAKDDQYWSVVEQQANPEGDNARLREALTEIATLNRSRDQLQEMARSVLASPAPVPAEAVAPVGEWREVDLDHFLKGRRRSPAYFPATGEICEVSGPHCDDDNGYTWGQTAVLWQNDLFVLYGNKGFWPVLHKREHVLFRPVTPSASPAVQGGDHGE